MKYIVIDIKDGDMFDKEFDSKDEALKNADKDWNYLTENEKKSREAFYVLESVNPDEDAENHYDGNVIKNYKEVM